MVAIEILALLLAVLLIIVLGGMLGGFWSGRTAGPRQMPTVSLVRLTGLPSHHEEVRLLVNDCVIRSISDEAARSADYQSQVEELEVLASSLASALGVEVWLRRLEGREATERGRNLLPPG